MNIAANRHNLG